MLSRSNSQMESKKLISLINLISYQGQIQNTFEKFSLNEETVDKEKLLQELKKFKGSDGWIRNFKNRYKISRRKINSKTKILASSVTPKVEAFFQEVEEIKRQNPETVFLNLDESGIFFEMTGDYSLDLSSSKKTRIRTCGMSKQRCTVIPIMGSDGFLFPPIIIFKTASEKNQNKEAYMRQQLHRTIINKLDERGALVLGNKKAWNNSSAMLTTIIPFIKKIIAQRYKDKAKNIVLVMDNFSGHINNYIINKLVRLGIIHDLYTGM
jgi:hypothetical protein